MLQVDGEIAIVTASNFNVRSSWYNTEAGLLLHDVPLAAAVRKRVDDMTTSRGWTLECSDGSRLGLDRPALRFDEAEQARMRREIGDHAQRIQAYGPAF
jgi:phosphatidylserine/phosphatidylglycerophosphate/cardiolipin synthase-like enzyme